MKSLLSFQIHRATQLHKNVVKKNIKQIQKFINRRNEMNTLQYNMSRYLPRLLELQMHQSAAGEPESLPGVSLPAAG